LGADDDDVAIIEPPEADASSSKRKRKRGEFDNESEQPDAKKLKPTELDVIALD